MTLIILGKATNARGHNGNVGNKRSRVQCDCGRIVVVRTSHLASGKVTKCYVCVRRDANTSEQHE